GILLAKRLRELKPELVLVAMTGFSEELTPETIAESGFSRLVYKPIIGAKLADAIRSALDEHQRK
ncbi:MAG TPA: hypothetical protein PKO06_19125, partial [Candidatus Ozemobacteraceae bacterium]|nr:hypothetical protein [Candidatus Ozemobacteraceae bacterium]